MSAYIPVSLRQQIYQRFKGCCAYCKTSELLTTTTFEFEHIQPRSAGGKTVFENLCLACPSCNRYKASRQKVIDPETQKSVFLFHPQQQIWSEHFAWSGDATKILGLTAIGRATLEALKINREELIRVRKMWVTLGEHPPL